LPEPAAPPHDCPPERPPASHARGTGWIALALLLAACAQASVFAMRWDCFDFYQFWVVGQAAREADTGDVWSKDERLRLGQEWARRAVAEQGPQSADPSTRRGISAKRRQDLETYSTPWLYTLFGWSASGDYDTDLGRFQHAGLAAFVLAVLGLARLAGLSWSGGALLAAFLVTFFAPTLSDMRVGNVNRLQVAALALALVAGARRGAWQLAAGFALGLAVMFKPNLAYPALVLGLGWIVLGRRQRLARQVPAALAGAAAAFGLASAWFGGAHVWRDWSRVLGELMGEYDHALSKGNFALVRLLEDSGMPAAGAVVGALMLAGLGAALFLRRRAGAPAAQEDLALAGLGGALSVSTSRLAWVHYYLLVVPLAIYLLRPAAPAWARAGGAVALVLVAHEPLKDLLRLEDTGTLAAALVGAGVLALYALTLLDLARPASARATTEVT
jgi:hypothetical protein